MSFHIKNGGIGFHSLVLLPIFGEAQEKATRPNLNPEVSTEQRARSSNDLKQALDHRKAQLGVEIGLNTYYVW